MSDKNGGRRWLELVWLAATIECHLCALSQQNATLRDLQGCVSVYVSVWSMSLHATLFVSHKCSGSCFDVRLAVRIMINSPFLFYGALCYYCVLAMFGACACYLGNLSACTLNTPIISLLGHRHWRVCVSWALGVCQCGCWEGMVFC